MSARALAAAAALALTIASLACAGPANRQASGHNALRPEERNQSHAEQSVCVSDDVLYQAGDAMPAPTPCARCVCTPPRSLCAPLPCAQTPGCKALQRPNQCCPEYQCECERRGRVYANGERLSDADAAEEGGGGDPCRACYCRGGEVVCAAVECYRRDDCEPQLVPGRCCPKYDHCPPLAMDARPHHTRATFQPHAPDDQLPGASSIQAAALPWADEGSGAPTTTTTSTEGEELLTRLFVLSKEAELDPTTVSTEYTDLPEEMSTAPSPAPTDGGSPEVVKDLDGEWSSDLSSSSSSSSSLSSSSSSTPSSSEEEHGEKGEEGGPPILLIGDDLANHQMDIVVAPEEEGETLSTTDVANVPFTEEGTTEEPLTTLLPTTDDMLGDQPHTQLSSLRVRLAQDKETSTEESQETTEEEQRTTVAGESQSTTPTTESEASTQPPESQPTTQQPESETTTQPSESEPTTQQPESEPTTQTSESEPTTQSSESEPTTQPLESEATTQQPESEATTQQPEYEPSTQQTESEASTQPSEFESSTQPEESEATTQHPESEASTVSSEYPAHTELLLKIAPEQSTEEQGTEEQGPPGAEEATEEALSSEEMSTPPPDTTSSDAAAPTTVAGDAKINPEVLGLKPTAAPAPANATADPDAATTLSPHWLKDEAEAEAQRIERRVDEADKKDLFLLEDFFTKLYRHQIATDAASKER